MPNTFDFKDFDKIVVGLSESEEALKMPDFVDPLLGKAEPTPEQGPEQAPPIDYKLSPELAKAVYLALKLGKPLLITGEPGTGKTQLAHYLAYRFACGPLLVFHAKSNSQARDLLYRYDYMGHFREIQLAKEGKADTASRPEHEYAPNIFLGPLGEALLGERRRVLLIDEIDKAPRDFPNDLLNELDRMEFVIDELEDTEKRRIKGDPARRPVVIITSNSEKGLPDAFLRRCLFFEIPSPKGKQLADIVLGKFKQHKDFWNKDELGKLVGLFDKLREKIDEPKNAKLPSTDEAIHFILVLHHRSLGNETLRQQILGIQLEGSGKPSKELRELLLEILPVLAKDKAGQDILRAALRLDPEKDPKA